MTINFEWWGHCSLAQDFPTQLYQWFLRDIPSMAGLVNRYEVEEIKSQ